MNVLQIGDVLRGFCAGYFGRDSYDDKIVEAIGRDWVVARGEDGIAIFACHEHFENNAAEALFQYTQRYNDQESLI